MISQMTAGRFESRQAGQVDRRLRSGRRGPGRRRHGHAEGTCGPAVPGPWAWRRPAIATRTVWARSAALMPVLMPSAASTLTVNAVPKRAVLSSVCGYRPNASHLSVGHRQADQPPAEFRHEVDDLRRNLLGRADQIPLIFAVFRIHQDDHLALPEVLKHLRNFTELLYVHNPQYTGFRCECKRTRREPPPRRLPTTVPARTSGTAERHGQLRGHENRRHHHKLQSGRQLAREHRYDVRLGCDQV